MMKKMNAKTVKIYLEEAVENFENGERDQAIAILEELDIALVAKCLDCYPFEGMEYIANYFDLVKCEDCGNWVDGEDTARTANGTLVCSRCLDDNYIYVNSEDEFYYIDDCYQCQDCGEWFIDNSDNCIEVLDNDGDTALYVCSDCAENNYYFWNSDEQYHDEPEPEANYITDYHDDQRDFVFSHVDSDGEVIKSVTADNSNLYLGFELEMYHKGYTSLADHDPLAEQLKNQFNVDCTEDGYGYDDWDYGYDDWHELDELPIAVQWVDEDMIKDRYCEYLDDPQAKDWSINDIVKAYNDDMKRSGIFALYAKVQGDWYFIYDQQDGDY